jgi:DNA-binding IclR family transcriptional regulator
MLTVVAEIGPSFTLKELSAQLRLPASSTHRLLRVLVRSNLVERGKGQSYRPGRELYRLAALLRAKFDLGRAARPLLERLWTRWQETTVLCVYNAALRRANVAEVVLTRHPLAHVGEEERDAILAVATVGPLSGRPLPRRAALRADLQRIRAQGAAVYFDPGFELAGVAAPVFGAQQRLFGSLGVVMPTGRFDQQGAPAMSKAVRAAAEELSAIIALNG